jgi:hypothetical protein
VKITDMHDTLIRIDENVKRLVEKDTDKEERIRKLERSRWYHSGAVAAFAFVLSKLGIPMPGAH